MCTAMGKSPKPFIRINWRGKAVRLSKDDTLEARMTIAFEYLQAIVKMDDVQAITLNQ